MTIIEENNQKEVSNNPYDVLGISRTSSSEKARKVFLEKCKRLHPDKRLHGREEEEENNASFERMKAAYEKIFEREKEEKRDKEGEE